MPNDEIKALALKMQDQLHDVFMTAVELNLASAKADGVPGFSPAAVLGTVVSASVEVLNHMQDRLDIIEKRKK